MHHVRHLLLLMLLLLLLLLPQVIISPAPFLFQFRFQEVDPPSGFLLNLFEDCDNLMLLNRVDKALGSDC